MVELSKETKAAINQVYLYMFSALMVSFGVVYYLTNNQELLSYLTTGWMILVTFGAGLVAVIAIACMSNSKDGRVATICLYAFAAIFGILLAAIVTKYTVVSIVNCFLGAAILFFAMGFYGLVTKRDISNWGTMLVIALIAVIIISVINIFIGSSALEMLLSAVTILIFMAFNSHDHQEMVRTLDGSHTHGQVIMAAANLYLNFVNIFTNLLNLLGDIAE